MSKNLTKTAIKALGWKASGPAKQVRFDPRLPGFGVRVYPSGRKSYVLQYGAADKRRLMALGICSTGDDVDEWREKARHLIRRYEREGIDPMSERRRQEITTVGSVVDQYIEDRKTKWSAGEIKRATSRLDNHIGKRLAALPLNKLTRQNVRDMHKGVTARSPYEANRTVQLLRAAINWAIHELDWPTSDLHNGANPAESITLNKEKGRREWIRPQEIAAVIAAIEQESNPYLRAYFLLLLHSGARKSELLELEWRDVNLEGKTMLFRDTKNKTDHTVPLTSDSAEILAEIPRVKGNPYVFCGRRSGAHLVNPYKAWKRILGRAGIERRVIIHDLRRTVGSLLATRGRSIQQIKKLLNQKSDIAAKVYVEIADEAKAEMVEEMAKLLR